MSIFKIPAREEVSPNNQAIFDNLEKAIGKVPNLYAYLGRSKNSLGNYLNLQNAKTSISTKEREVINLVVSQINDCRYCLSAHTVFGKLSGFTDDQIIEIRKGTASFDPKLDALGKFVFSVTQNKGRIEKEILDNFFGAGYTEENMIDVVMVIGDKIISNYIHAITGIEIDWPLAVIL